MRLAMMIALVLAAGNAAQASSFVSLGNSESPGKRQSLGLSFSSPSFMVLGTSSVPQPDITGTTPVPAADAEPPAIMAKSPPAPISSPSFIVLGSPGPERSEERAASTGTASAPPRRARDQMPMVIRGGIQGDAFVRSDPGPARQPSQSPSAEERPERTAGPPPGAPPQRQRQEPSTPPPSPPPPRAAPPTGVPL